jgi:hypothetical protein
MIDIQPDFPPYYIIQASEQVDIIRPEDSIWLRIPFGNSYLCCGNNIALSLCDFEGGLPSGHSCERYRLGQCPTCRSVIFTEVENA